MKASFQIIFIVLFIASAIFGVLVFSGIIKLGGDDASSTGGTVVLWGTIRSEVMVGALEGFNNNNQNFNVKYVQKSAETFDNDLLEALASGKGPDMYFLPDNLAYHYANKIGIIPYTSYSLTSFKNNFAGAGEVFLTPTGLLAFPMTIDPLVMYYNRSTFDSNGIIYPPTTWDEISNDIVPVLTKKNELNKITKSAVALGHFSNVNHSKDILATLFMQAKNPITTLNGGRLRSSLSDLNPKYNLGSVLKFYTDFADPSHPTYSWNKSFSNSLNTFSSEDLAIYFGFASELKSLVDRNPNQNFSVAPVPQIKGESVKVTGARVMGLAISSFSKNFNTAFTAASLMATGDFASKLSLALSVPPARRDLLAIKPVDSYSPIFYNSALYARSYLDPSSDQTDDIFRTMIDGVLSNNMTPNDAISDASSKLDLLLAK
ncbi:MAG: extracellular solute-binding protein [Patescibacteria group bacterium]